MKIGKPAFTWGLSAAVPLLSVLLCCRRGSAGSTTLAPLGSGGAASEPDERQLCSNDSLAGPQPNCSCSRPCFLFDNCCTPRFSGVSEALLAESFAWPLGAVKAVLRQSGVRCAKPSLELNPVVAQGRLRFADDVSSVQTPPPCHRRGSMASTWILEQWPVFETRTGLVFSNIDQASCVGVKIRQRSNSSFARTSVVRAWPSYSLFCAEDPVLQARFRQSFDPFSSNDSELFRNSPSCFVRLMPVDDERIAFCELASAPEPGGRAAKGRYLMSFRLLMDFSADPNSSVYIDDNGPVPFYLVVARYAVLGCLVLSVVSLAVMLLIYSLFRRLRNLPGKVTMCLSSALFTALVGYSVGVLGIPNIWFPVCCAIGVAVHFCFLASFFFGSCLAFDVWLTFRATSTLASDASMYRSAASSRRLFMRYNLVSWGCPAVIVGLAVVADFTPLLGHHLPRPRYSSATGTPSNQSLEASWVCWMMNPTAVMAYFSVPIGVCLSTSTVFFVLTVILIARASEHSVKVNAKGSGVTPRRRLVIYFRLSTIMGLTWLLGLIAAVAQLELIWLLYAICNALQGFYICLSFVCTRRVIRMLKLWISTGSRDFDARRHSSVCSSTGDLSQRQLNILYGRTGSRASIAHNSSSNRPSLSLTEAQVPLRTLK